jgi:hypothetical protein
LRSLFHSAVLAIESLAPDKVNFQSLLRPGKERLVLASFQIFPQRVLRMQVDAAPAGDPRYEQVLFIGHAGLFIIDDLVIAIESKSVLDVPAHAKDGNGLVGGSESAQSERKRSRPSP